MSRHLPGETPDAGHGDDHSGDLPPLGADWTSLVVPDDASALEDDARALRRERAERRRGQRWAAFGIRLTARPTGPRRASAWGPVIVVAVVVSALFAGLMLVLPNAPRPPRSHPLATTSIDSGELGGLVPALTLIDSTGVRRSLRELRPAVVVLAPRGCSCTASESAVIEMTQDTQVGVVLVTGDDAATVPRNAPIDRVHAFADPAQRVAAALHVGSEVPSAVLIGADGTVRQLRQIADPTDAAALRDSAVALTAR